MDLYGERDPITTEQFIQIANAKNEAGGRNLLIWIERQIIQASNQLVGVDPNNAGAVAQLQARIAAYEVIRQLMNADPAKYKETTDAGN